MTHTILNIHHSSLIVSDTQASVKFYVNVIGLKPLERPSTLPFPGAWFEIGSQQLHLLELENPDPTTGRPEHGGKDRHVAFYILNIEDLKQTLDNAEISYTLSISGRKALFCRDPDGNALEFIEKPD
jgi:glyoxylase I family protein